ncbi:WD40 repeat domain-containing protein [Zavarzinella formosa]|uniref:WD40 repeat domain-containing protein n=1 Tax=Zavarzinella formosa TaxID=360055 RepID=UPI0002D62D34|nr:WD40 repeat domain-containing protein [Zavarzinella formosa]
MLKLRRILTSSLLAGLMGPLAVTAQEKEPTIVFKGHTDAVYSVAQTPDGKLIATGSFDRTVRLWDAATGKQVRSYGGTTGHQSLVLSVAVHPSGEYMATGGSDNAVFLWDIPTRTAVREFPHSASVVATSVSNDGKTLGGLGKDGAIRLWQTADGKQLQAIPAVRGGGTTGMFTSNGQQFVAATDDGFVRWFNTTDGKQTASLGATKGTITGLTVAGNSVVTTDEEGQLKFWQTPTVLPKPLPPHTDAITTLQTSPDGSFLVTVGADKVIKAVSTNSGTVGKEFTAPAPVTSLAIWPNGTIVAVGQPDGKAILWNRTEGKVVETLSAHPKKVSGIAVHPNGSSFITVADDGTANVWAFPIVKPKPAKDAKDPKDPGEVKPTATFKIPGGDVLGLIFHNGRNQVLVLTADKTVKLFDVPAGKEARTVATLPIIPKAFTVSRDFATLAVVLDKSVKMFNIADGKENGTIALPTDATSVAFSADKTKLITGHADKTARVWDVAKGGFIQAVEHTGPITGVAFNQNQPLVYVVSSDKTGAILPIQQPRISPISMKPLRAMTLTANGSHVVVGGDEPLVRALNAGNGNEEKKFEGAEGPVYAVAVSKNVQTVAVGGADKTIRLFQFNDVKPLANIPATGVIRALAFHPSGNMLVSITEDKILTAWGVTYQQGQPLPDDFGSMIQQWTLPDAGTSVSFSDKGDLYVGLADKTVKQFKIAGNTPMRAALGHPNLVDAVAFAPNGKLLASGCHDGLLRLFDTEKWAAVNAIPAHSTPAPGAAIYSVTWTLDSKQILTTSFDKSMKLWDATGGKMVIEFKGFSEKGNTKGHQDQVFTAIFTKDGKTIISGSSDRHIKKWNVADGSVTGEFVNPNIKGEPGQAHPGGIYGLRLTPDEKYLISVGPAPRNRGYIAVWNMADGKLVSGTETSTGPIYTLALTPDGKSIIVGCGPKVRQVPEAEALVIPLNLK